MSDPQPSHAGGVKTMREVIKNVYIDGLEAHLPPEQRGHLGNTADPIAHAQKLAESIMQDYAMKYAESLIGEDVKKSQYVLNMGVVHNPPTNTTRTNLVRQGANLTKAQLRTTNLTRKGVL